MEIKIKVKNKDFLPLYATKFSSGADLFACMKEDILISPGEIKLIPTGIFLEIPLDTEAQIRPRSGLALKYGISVLNTPGTIDADYRGEVQVILVNHGKETFTITCGMRIAQIVFMKVERAIFIQEKKLSETVRREGGFGHSGL